MEHHLPYPLTSATAMQRIVTEIASKQGINLTGPGGPTGLQDPLLGVLTIKNLGPDRVLVAQHESPRLRDVAIIFYTQNDNWIPLEITYHHPDLHVQCARVEADGHLRLLKPRAQADLAAICNTWAVEIETQGWLRLPSLYS